MIVFRALSFIASFVVIGFGIFYRMESGVFIGCSLLGILTAMEIYREAFVISDPLKEEILLEVSKANAKSAATVEALTKGVQELESKIRNMRIFE